jgi:co-chaperonin GroES (HSP10)
VTVILDPKPKATESGIVLPDTAEASYRTGVVQASGPEAGYKKMGEEYRLCPGDRVMVGTQKDRTGHVVNLGTIQVDGRDDIVLVNYTDIWGVVEPVTLN